MAKDEEADKIVKFDEVYTKLMKVPDDDELEERYVGKRRLASQPSLNYLSRI